MQSKVNKYMVFWVIRPEKHATDTQNVRPLC